MFRENRIQDRIRGTVPQSLHDFLMKVWEVVGSAHLYGH